MGLLFVQVIELFLEPLHCPFHGLNKLIRVNRGMSFSQLKIVELLLQRVGSLVSDGLNLVEAVFLRGNFTYSSSLKLKCNVMGQPKPLRQAGEQFEQIVSCCRDSRAHWCQQQSSPLAKES